MKKERKQAHLLEFQTFQEVQPLINSSIHNVVSNHDYNKHLVMY